MLDTKDVSFDSNTTKLRQEQAEGTTSGSALDVSLAVSPMRDESGNIIGASKIARDVTGRVRTERRRAAQYAVTNLLGASWMLAEVATELLEAMALSGDWAFAAIWTYDEAAARLNNDISRLPLHSRHLNTS